MESDFTFRQFIKRYPDDEACLDDIIKQRYPQGIHCVVCNKKTTHYKLESRRAYTCKTCRHQVYPLAGTIFEKSVTPLRLWFYALFLMTHTRAEISVKQLQRELGVTYKTAWRMYKQIRKLMALNNADLLAHTVDEKILRWKIFNKFEITFVQKQISSVTDYSDKTRS